MRLGNSLSGALYVYKIKANLRVDYINLGLMRLFIQKKLLNLQINPINRPKEALSYNFLEVEDAGMTASLMRFLHFRLPGFLSVNYDKRST